MADQESENKKMTSKPAAKQSVKKADSKKTSTDTEQVVQDRQKETLAAIKTIVSEMRTENQNRDKQIMSLVQEVSKSFESVSTASHKLEDRNMTVVRALSESIIRDHEETRKELEEHKSIQDKQIEQLSKMHEHRSERNRWIAIPGVVIAIIGIVYMFYVVTVMDEAMTSMSSDIHNMQAAVVNMSNKMDIMSTDTSSMNTNMNNLNRNMVQMSKDLNVLTYNVAPTMNGMRNMMPWVN